MGLGPEMHVREGCMLMWFMQSLIFLFSVCKTKSHWNNDSQESFVDFLDVKHNSFTCSALYFSRIEVYILKKLI